MASVQVRELTHCNKDGIPYRRETAVERQIEAAFQLSRSILMERARLRDREAPGYLQEECLVCLLRAYTAEGDAATVAALSEALLERCARFINGKLMSLGRDAAEEAYSEVMVRLFDLILDVESDRGDFLQVRFWLALEKLVVTAFGRQTREITRSRLQVPLSALPGASGGDDEEPRVTAQVEEIAERNLPPDVALLYREALALLDEPLRTAFVLRHYEGWPIEDRDETVPTISRYFNKTPRTIRNWMTTAEQALAAWRGEHV
jgi:DNA-directed RNA polymerase specialized sigma24 family protein